jgi:hypothetical protein
VPDPLVDNDGQVVPGLLNGLPPPSGKVSPSDILYLDHHRKIGDQVRATLRSVRCP